MNKNELIDAVAGRIGDRRTAAAAVEAVLDVVGRTIAGGERVALSGFGVFEKVDRGARSARNPATGGTVEVAATSVPRFRAGTTLKAVVSGKRELPPVAEPDSERRAPARPRRTPAATASRSATPQPSDATAPATEARPGTEDRSGKKDGAGRKGATKEESPSEEAPTKKASGKKASAKKASGKKDSAGKKAGSSKKGRAGGS